MGRPHSGTSLNIHLPHQHDCTCTCDVGMRSARINTISMLHDDCNQHGHTHRVATNKPSSTDLLPMWIFCLNIHLANEKTGDGMPILIFVVSLSLAAATVHAATVAAVAAMLSFVVNIMDRWRISLEIHLRSPAWVDTQHPAAAAVILLSQEWIRIKCNGCTISLASSSSNRFLVLH